MAENITNEEIIDPERFKRQKGIVTKKLQGLVLDRLVVAAISGMPTTQIASELGLTPEQVGVVPSGKVGDEYAMGRIVRFVESDRNRPGCLANKRVGVGDEGANTHGLLPKIAEEVVRHGGTPHTYAFIARKADSSIMPNTYGEDCPGAPPKPYWKFGWREPGVGDVLERAGRLGVTLNAMIAVGSLTAAAETATALKEINGMYVGGLPHDMQGGIVTDWLEMGDCEGRNVMVFGSPDVDLEHAAHMVTQTKGTPYIFRLGEA